MNGKSSDAREHTHEIISTQYFQISYHRIFLWFLQASTRLQTVEEDGSVWCIIRSVGKEIFESDLPRLRILIVQELEKLGWLLAWEGERKRGRAHHLSQVRVRHDVQQEGTMLTKQRC